MSHTIFCSYFCDKRTHPEEIMIGNQLLTILKGGLGYLYHIVC